MPMYERHLSQSHVRVMWRATVRIRAPWPHTVLLDHDGWQLTRAWCGHNGRQPCPRAMTGNHATCLRRSSSSSSSKGGDPDCQHEQQRKQQETEQLRARRAAAAPAAIHRLAAVPCHRGSRELLVMQHVQAEALQHPSQQHEAVVAEQAGLVGRSARGCC
jgi:hypothetical protein